MILRISIVKERYPTDLCNGVLCFLCGTDRICKYSVIKTIFGFRGPMLTTGTKQSKRSV